MLYYTSSCGSAATRLFVAKEEAAPICEKKKNQSISFYALAHKPKQVKTKTIFKKLQIAPRDS